MRHVVNAYHVVTTTYVIVGVGYRCYAIAGMVGCSVTRRCCRSYRRYQSGHGHCYDITCHEMVTLPS